MKKHRWKTEQSEVPFPVYSGFIIANPSYMSISLSTTKYQRFTPLEVSHYWRLPIRLFTPLEISSLTGRVGLLTGQISVIISVQSAVICLSMVVFGFIAIVPSVNAATIGKPMQFLGLVGYWSFDVGKGGAKAVDMSGSGKTKNRLAAAFVGLNLVLPALSPMNSVILFK